MSAIAGIVRLDGGPVARDTLEAMAAVPDLGRDGTSSWCEGSAGLIRLALNTTPEAAGDRQPCLDRQARSVVVFDGRIDNRGELIALLQPEEGAGLSDAALVQHAHARFGDGLMSRLVGDYAFAVWEPQRQRLLCARSPVGWRSLQWVLDGDLFAFATEPAMLVRGLGRSRAINEAAIAEHLSSRFVTPTETFWQGVHRLQPEWALVLERGELRTWRWHDHDFEDSSDLSEADHIDRFRALFDQALVATTRSNGPVASHLSGGLDSSTIVCRIQELARAGAVAPLARAMSVRFPGELHDEGEWISAVEEHSGLRATMRQEIPFDPGRAGEWCASTLHLPLRPNTAGTIVSVCEQLHADGIRVLLTGEGGDDWLDGSRAHWPDLLKRGRIGRVLAEAYGESPGPFRALRATRWALGAGLAPIILPSRRARMLFPHISLAQDLPEWIDPDWARGLRLSERWQDARPSPDSGFAATRRSQVYAIARRHVNADNVVAFAARRGVEMRHPFHDLRLTRFLAGAAGGMLLRNGRKKHLLREAMRGTLPEKVRTRRGKANISAPIIDGVEARIRQRPFAEMHCVRQGWVKAETLQRYHARHLAWRNGGRVDDLPDVPYGCVWNAVAVDLWLEHAAGL